jgi:predicted RNA-binding protein YlqC (UPF0109 family)
MSPNTVREVMDLAEDFHPGLPHAIVMGILELWNQDRAIAELGVESAEQLAELQAKFDEYLNGLPQGCHHCAMIRDPKYGVTIEQLMVLARERQQVFEELSSGLVDRYGKEESPKKLLRSMVDDVLNTVLDFGDEAGLAIQLRNAERDLDRVYGAMGRVAKAGGCEAKTLITAAMDMVKDRGGADMLVFDHDGEDDTSDDTGPEMPEFLKKLMGNLGSPAIKVGVISPDGQVTMPGDDLPELPPEISKLIKRLTS